MAESYSCREERGTNGLPTRIVKQGRHRTERTGRQTELVGCSSPLSIGLPRSQICGAHSFCLDPLFANASFSKLLVTKMVQKSRSTFKIPYYFPIKKEDRRPLLNFQNMLDCNRTWICETFTLESKSRSPILLQMPKGGHGTPIKGSRRAAALNPFQFCDDRRLRDRPSLLLQLLCGDRPSSPQEKARKRERGGREGGRRHFQGHHCRCLSDGSISRGTANGMQCCQKRS